MDAPRMWTCARAAPALASSYARWVSGGMDAPVMEVVRLRLTQAKRGRGMSGTGPAHLRQARKEAMLLLYHTARAILGAGRGKVAHDRLAQVQKGTFVRICPKLAGGTLDAASWRMTSLPRFKSAVNCAFAPNVRTLALHILCGAAPLTPLGFTGGVPLVSRKTRRRAHAGLGIGLLGGNVSVGASAQIGMRKEQV